MARRARSSGGKRRRAAAAGAGRAAITVDGIRAAERLLAGRVLRTPSLSSQGLSELTGADIVLKLENLQVTGSFKPRGAFVKLISLNARD